jgi:polyhydroxybutyrate depolymerase
MQRMHAHVTVHKRLLLLVMIVCLLTGCNTLRATQNGRTTVRHVILPGMGCGKRSPLSPGSSANETIVSGGLKRSYRLHIPRGYRNEIAHALVLNFHGHGSNALVQERFTGMSQLADRYSFIVAYPQGTTGLDRRTGWNTGPSNFPHVDDVGFSSDLIDHLQFTLCVDPHRIYAVGFSNGGGMANVLACKLSGRIAAFAIVSGSMHPVANGCHPAQPVSLLEIHGTGDKTAPYAGNRLNDDEFPITQWLADWAVRDDCASNPTVFLQQSRVTGEQWNSCRDNTTIIHYRIYGGKHTWPRTGFAHDADGQAINATSLIWQFFWTHQLKSPSI